MGYKRLIIQDGGMTRNARVGDSEQNPLITVISADAADTLTVTKCSGGVVQYTGFTAGRVLTTDTAANYLAAYPEMDIGDAYLFKVSCVAAFAGTWAAAAGVTLKGKTTCPASSNVDVYIVKTSATTVDWNVL